MEKKEFLDELGIGQSGLDRLITASYELLGLISFLTAGEDECRAWTIKKGTKAPQAAGKIHTDFEKGFIRAEIVPFETLAELGSKLVGKRIRHNEIRADGFPVAVRISVFPPRHEQPYPKQKIHAGDGTGAAADLRCRGCPAGNHPDVDAK